MGYRCRWIAVKGRDLDDVVGALKFERVAEHREEVHDTGLYALGVGPWVVVIGDGWDHMDLVRRRAAVTVADRGEALYFYTDDSGMSAELAAFAGKDEVWSVAYDGSVEHATPTLYGDVPATVRAAIEAAPAAQAAAGEDAYDHTYEAVAEIALALTGFRHDQTLSEAKHLPIYELRVRR